MKIKTIDIQAKEWTDKVNGCSYFTAQVTVNFGMSDEKIVLIPFQYGYGEHYQEVAVKELLKQGIIDNYWGNNSALSICKAENIILRASKQEKCKKKEILEWVR